MIAHGALDRTARLIQADFYPSASLDEIVEELTGLRVRLTASPESLASGSGRSALVATFIATAQLGAQMIVEIPEGIRSSGQPPIDDGDLGEALFGHAERLILPATASGAGDVTLAIGGPGAPGSVSLAGSDWGFRLTVGRPAGSWAGSLPFGGILAGAAGAAEALRVALTRLSRRFGRPYGNLRLVPRDAVLALPSIPSTSELDLGEMDFVSAGAITNCALFTLLRIERLRGRLRIFDPDAYEVSNLNRYPLLDRRGLGQGKAVSLESFGQGCLTITGVDERVDEASLAELGPLGGTVCVGVDHVPSRWAVQRSSRGWVGVGATSHLLAMASEHVPGHACAGCLHPRDDPEADPIIPTVSFVSLLAGALLAHRLLAHRAVPKTLSTYTQVLDAMNLASRDALVCKEVSPVASCPVGCPASSAGH